MRSAAASLIRSAARAAAAAPSCGASASAAAAAAGGVPSMWIAGGIVAVAARGIATGAAASLLTRAAPAATAQTVQHQQHQRGFAAAAAGGAGDDEAAAAASDAYAYEDRILYPAPRAFVGEPAPDFTAPAVIDGEIRQLRLRDLRGSYVCLFFYPKDFTFVCPTEIIAFSDRAAEFEALNCKVVAASTDTEECHLAWVKTPRSKGGLGFMQIPLVADTTKEIAARYGVLLERAGIALRGLFLINPQGVVQQVTVNDLPIGRSVDETLRLLQAIQFHAEHGEVCPADWKPGAKTIVADPERSLEYFAGVEDHAGDAEAYRGVPAVATRRDFDALIASDKPTVIDFMAGWCGKCKMIAPLVSQLAARHPDLTFARVDTSASDELAALADELGVKALPAFKFYRGGREARGAVVGYKRKPLEEAVEALSRAP